MLFVSPHVGKRMPCTASTCVLRAGSPMLGAQSTHSQHQVQAWTWMGWCRRSSLLGSGAYHGFTVHPASGAVGSCSAACMLVGGGLLALLAVHAVLCLFAVWLHAT